MFLTGAVSRSEVGEQDGNGGGHLYLVKPVKPTALMSIIDERI
jgi:hypothetical protein